MVQAVVLGQIMRNTMKLMCDLVKSHKIFAGSCLFLGSSFAVTSNESNSFMWMKIGEVKKLGKGVERSVSGTDIFGRGAGFKT